MGLLRRGEAGDAGSSPACTTDCQGSPEQVTLSLQASASPAVEQGFTEEQMTESEDIIQKFTQVQRREKNDKVGAV